MKKGLWERFLQRQAFKRAVDFLMATEDGSLDRASFVAWLLKHPRNARAYLVAWSKDRDMSRLLRESRSGRPHRRGKTAGPAAVLTPSSFRRHARRKASRRRVIGLSAAAAAIAVVISLGGSLYAPTYATGASGSRVIELPDYSRVHLNKQTRLRVWTRDDRREVELLAGEAYFDVVHDGSRPFRVLARGAIAQDLGTQFGVKLDGDELSVTVKQGRVAVLAQGDATSQAARVELCKSEMARIDLGREHRLIEVRSLSVKETRRAFAWTGSFSLSGMPLREAVKPLNLSNTMQIVIDDPSIGDVQLSGRISLIDPERFVDQLRTLGIFATETRGGASPLIHLSRAPANEDMQAQSPRIESEP